MQRRIYSARRDRIPSRIRRMLVLNRAWVLDRRLPVRLKFHPAATTLRGLFLAIERQPSPFRIPTRGAPIAASSRAVNLFGRHYSGERPRLMMKAYSLLIIVRLQRQRRGARSNRRARPVWMAKASTRCQTACQGFTPMANPGYFRGMRGQHTLPLNLMSVGSGRTLAAQRRRYTSAVWTSP